MKDVAGGPAIPVIWRICLRKASSELIYCMCKHGKLFRDWADEASLFAEIMLHVLFL